MTEDERINRHAAISSATATYGAGHGWCLSCKAGGWAGALPEHVEILRAGLGREPTTHELEIFSRDFRHMLSFLPPIPCAQHTDGTGPGPCPRG